MPWPAHVLLLFTLGMACGSWCTMCCDAYRDGRQRRMIEAGVATVASAICVICVMVYQ